MVALGLLGLALAVLTGIGGNRVDWAELMEANPEFARQADAQGVTDADLRAGATGFAVLAGVASLAYGVLGLFVRGGGRASATLGLVATAGAIALFLLIGLSLAGGGGGGSAAGQLFGGLCLVLLPLTLLGLTAAWLVGARRNAGRVRAMRDADGFGALPGGSAYPPPPPGYVAPGGVGDAFGYPPPPDDRRSGDRQ